MKRLLFAGLVIPVLAVSAGAQGVQVDPALGSYQKIEKELTGNLNAVGSDTMINLMGRWQESFRRYYPGVTIGVEGKGSSTAPPALIKATAQLGPMSRAMKDKERDDFIKRYGYAPTQVRTCMDALAVYVHKNNPISGLTLKQVDAIFSKNRKLGYDRDVTNWEQVGLDSAAISLYGRNSASGTYGFFKSVALGKGDYKDIVKEQPGSAAVVSSVATDRFGIGYSGIGYKTSEVRAVPLGKKDGQFFKADLDNVVQGRYPLGRFLYLYVNKAPNRSFDPLQAEFLKFILSKEGQQCVIDAGYLPLPAKVANKMRVDLGFKALKPNPSPASGKKGLQVDAKIGMYRKINKELSGNLNAVGSDTMINLMGKWQESFRRYYPGVTIGVEGKGSSTAPPALIKGTAQLGPMSRAMKDKERDEFIKRYGYAPTQVRTCMDALAVYVHKDNPIPGLTLKQVDAIFSKNRKLGFPRNLDNWGSLGIGPAAISLYGRNSASGTYGFFKSVALGKGDYKDTVKEQPGSAGVVSSVANDRHGIGYSGIGYKTSEVRAVPLGKEAGKFFEADLNNVIQNKYPLGRFLYLYINKTPNKEMDQLQAEFLKFILSKEGQQDVIAAGYLPMPAKLVDRMRKELGFEPISL